MICILCTLCTAFHWRFILVYVFIVSVANLFLPHSLYFSSTHSFSFSLFFIFFWLIHSVNLCWHLTDTVCEKRNAKSCKTFFLKKICEPFAITDKAIHVFAFIYADGECKWAGILCVRFMSVSKFRFEWLFSYFLQIPSSSLRLSRCVAKFLVLAKWKFSMERLAY